MLTRRSLRLKKFFDIRRHFNGDAQSQVQSVLFRFSEKREKLPKRAPFLKNILMKQFDSEIFTVPNVQLIDRYKEFEIWVTQVNNYIQHIEWNKKLEKREILSNLSTLDVFKAYVDEEYDGLDLLETESLKLIETLSALPWLGTYLVKNVMVPVKLISKYGSNDQKEKYFPGIMSGEIIPTICLKEKNNGTNINHNNMFVSQHDKESWCLNGQKSFVFNGTNANLFLVFAKTSPSIVDTDNITLFLVEGNSNGITCTETCEVIGCHEVPICSVNFDNTIVPSTNILGEPKDGFNIMMDLLKPENQNIGAQCIAILRKFMKKLIPDILEMKHFDRDFYTLDVVKNVLAELTNTLYTMESMNYLTSKLIDLYENQDVEIEKIITQMYCANKCLSSIQSALQLVGAQIYMSDNTYLNAYHSVLALTTLDANNLDGQIYLASSVMKHMGGTVYEDILKLRNEPIYPFFSLLKRYSKAILEQSISIKCFHPSLEIATVHLIQAIEKTTQCIETLLIRHGSYIMNNHSDLLRISQMIIELYAIVANISRASNSYAFGYRNSDIEKDIVTFMTYQAFTVVEKIALQIEQNEVVNGDRYNKNVADLIYSQRMYPMEHPLHRVY